MDGEAMRPLPGRVAVREIIDRTYGSLVLPDTHADTERSAQRSSGKLAMSSHRGRVLGMGEPARTPKGNAPIAPQFAVGDEVVFVFAHRGTEESRQGTWEDGEPCVWIAQEEVIAVVERCYCDGRGWYLGTVEGTEDDYIPDMVEKFCSCESGRRLREAS